ncbi:MAG: hypothetical protein RL095_173 [Verrucomicrobiota bacterium]|jgi:uncharacterized protein (TIGR02452 family)
MNRDQRVLCAQQTLKAIEDGYYTLGERRIELAASIQAAISGTVGIRPDALIPTVLPGRHETRFAVTAESTMAASCRLAASGRVCALNFASAKNPGGGFLSGAQAQEEALTRSSALHPCLLTQPNYYRDNKYYKTLLYTDHMIYSPGVPFFRDDEGGWLDAPVLVSVITSPAPNAGAVASQEPESLPSLEACFARRISRLLAIVASRGEDRLVLGAWGCGVFGNDPELVAHLFHEALHGEFRGVFKEVVFAIYESKGDVRRQAFAKWFD